MKKEDSSINIIQIDNEIQEELEPEELQELEDHLCEMINRPSKNILFGERNRRVNFYKKIRTLIRSLVQKL
jgi:hypothetical protein